MISHSRFLWQLFDIHLNGFISRVNREAKYYICLPKIAKPLDLLLTTTRSQKCLFIYPLFLMTNVQYFCWRASNINKAIQSLTLNAFKALMYVIKRGSQFLYIAQRWFEVNKCVLPLRNWYGRVILPVVIILTGKKNRTVYSHPYWNTNHTSSKCHIYQNIVRLFTTAGSFKE